MAEESEQRAQQKVIRLREALTTQIMTSFRVWDVKANQWVDGGYLRQFVLEEQKAGRMSRSLTYCDLEGFALTEHGDLIIVDECGRWEFPPGGRFEIRESHG